MDLEVKSMVRVQKEIYWASPQEPRFLGENPPFPRQAPFLSAPGIPHNQIQIPLLLVPFKAVKWQKSFPLVISPPPLSLSILYSYTDRTHRLPTMNVQAAQIIHDSMDHSSAIAQRDN